MIRRAAAENSRGPAAQSALVRFGSVTKRFPGIVANDAVSFGINAGEVHVLLGENGAGKSTLIGILAGMQQPDAGNIVVDGRATRIASPAHALALGIGTVFQHGMLVPGLSVAENLLLGGVWWRRPRRNSLRARFRDTCAAFGIAVDPDAVVGSLSLGEQQQVEIIRALWRGGKVVVLDEPTAMLTPQGIEELGGLMRRMSGQGVGVVFITHKLHEALDYGDRITVLRQGRVAGELDPDLLHGLPRRIATERIVGLMFGHAPTAPAGTAQTDEGAPRPAITGPPVLRARGLSLRDAAGRGVLHDISFEVCAGEVFGIAGIDGNGQTALAEMLAGQQTGNGTVTLDGRSLDSLDSLGRHRAGLRYVTDDRVGEGTVASFPVALNLLLKQIGQAPFWHLGLARDAAIEAYAARLVSDFDIRTPSVRTPIGRLSGGNIQKALLARELQGTARVVIYSKPTHGLDVRNIASARARIRSGAAAGLATVLISTDLEELLEMSDRIGIMLRGRLVGVVERGADSREAVGRLMVGAAHVN